MRRTLLGVLLSLLFVLPPRWATAVEDPKPLFNQQFAQGLDDLGRELRDWLGRWGDYLGSGTLKNEERPLIAFMLRNREKLDLSAAQVKNLEQLTNDFQKESIRKDADLRVAEMDLTNLLNGEKTDMAKAEAKVREIERIARRSADRAHPHHREGERAAHCRSAEKVARTAGRAAVRAAPALIIS